MPTGNSCFLAQRTWMSYAIDDARTRTVVHHLRATATPLLATRITRDGMPVIVLNTAGRPEVSDLLRVQSHVGQAGPATPQRNGAVLNAGLVPC